MRTKEVKEAKGVVLCIDPSTSNLGYSLLCNGVLKDFGVFKPSKSSVLDLFNSITDFFIDYVRSWELHLGKKLQIILVELAFISPRRGMKKSAKLAVVNELFGDIASELGTKHKFIAAKTAKKKVTGNGNASKDEVASIIVEMFPEIRELVYKNVKTGKYVSTDISDSVALFCAEYGEF